MNAAVFFDRGAALEGSGDLNGAKAAYLQTIELDPHHVEALASLAWLDAQAGDSLPARTWAGGALRLEPENVLARMALAFADLQEGSIDAAGNLLVQLYADPALTPLNRAIVLGLIGDLNDALGDAARAFKAYEAANAQLRSLHRSFEAPGKETALDHAQRLTAWFKAAASAPWQEAPPTPRRAADPKRHVFLVGFPRSGTTLLENVLAAHPDVVALEEKESLAKAAATYLTSDEGLEKLGRISSNEASQQRESYWAAVRGFGVDPRGRVFIDKMPLATVLLPLISKLFPNARVLFAIRDPRDVVLSSFRRRFGMNAAMFQLLTLEGAAAYYDAVMRLAALYREMLPIPVHEVRYESLIDDFKGTVRSVCDFLALDWNPAMADFATRARERGISTPSASQVARGLNREGRGTWHRYREQMAPVLPILEPWVRRFGYEPS